MDAQYFIDKFEAIPEERWCVLRLYDEDKQQCCANGHCGVRNLPWGRILTAESMALYQLFLKLDICCSEYDDDNYSISAARVNNGNVERYQQPTPKQRILAALRDIQLIEQQEAALKETEKIVAEGPKEKEEEQLSELID